MSAPQQILHPAWRKEYEPTPYPFGDWATLQNKAGTFIPEGTFLDASLYPINAGKNLRLSKIEVTPQTIELFIGDERSDELCSGTVARTDTLPNVALYDQYERPCGILVSTSEKLLIFQTLTTGTHEFTFQQTGFVPHVYLPVTGNYFQGFLLEDGSVMAGDIWLVGDDGIVLSHEEYTNPQTACEVLSGDDPVEQKIRIDIVGDPLFRQRLCADTAPNPRFVQKVTFSLGCDEIETVPDTGGGIKMVAGRADMTPSILRIRNITGVLNISAVGTQLQDATFDV